MAAEVPFKLVDWKGFESVEMFAGPRPVPLTTKMLPGAIDPLGNAEGVLLAAFATLAMTGAAESCAAPADITNRNHAGEVACLRIVVEILPLRRCSVLYAQM